jgi:Na+-driven multidrug efflux pump
VLFVGSFFQSRTINGFGNGLATKAVSCYSPIEQYLCMPLHAISSALLSFVAQNYGNEDFVRIKKGFKEVLLVDISIYIVIFIIGYSLIDHVPYIFMPKEEIDHVINGPIIKYYVSTFLHITIPFYILQGILTISRSTLQGIQKPMIPFISGVGELFARLAVCFFIPSIINPMNPISNESYVGVCFSTPFAWFVSVVIMGGSVIYFFKKYKNIESNY